MRRGHSTQAGQKDPEVQVLPGGPGDPLVQESQVAQDCQDDFLLKVLLVQGDLLGLEFQCLDFLSLP